MKLTEKKKKLLRFYSTVEDGFLHNPVKNYINRCGVCDLLLMVPVRHKICVLYVEKSTSCLCLKCAKTFRE
jgi:hypothetical protein